MTIQTKLKPGQRQPSDIYKLERIQGMLTLIQRNLEIACIWSEDTAKDSVVNHLRIASSNVDLAIDDFTSDIREAKYGTEFVKSNSDKS